jgi:branched-chain amino acid transport system ATP-binding protein
LTVRQNLLLGEKARKTGGRWTMDDMFGMFPVLKERAEAPGGVLSGGEQQMLTMCRTLMGDPDLVMIDEPTEGLSPMMVAHVGRLLEEIGKRGVSILLVEQKLTIALKISARLYVMGHGRIVFEGTPAELEANAAIRKEWLEV